MINISLHGAEFFAYHGLYPEEQKIGCHFLVNVDVSFTPSGDLIDDDLKNTVDYEAIYTIVCEEMKHSRKLIETVAQSIINRIKRQYLFAETIRVSVKKLNPPIKGKADHSAVTINYSKA